jgi:hypothetical protein
MSCPKDTRHDPSKLSHDALFLRCEATLCVGSDWLLSSSKLQPGLEWCRFAQAPLKTKVIRWKVHSFSEPVKRPMCNIHQNRWHVTRGMQPERRVLPLESCSYNKSHPSPEAYCFSKIDERKPFLVVRILV